MQTLRAQLTSEGRVLRREGDNLRYAAIVALGAAKLPIDEQRTVLVDDDAISLCASVERRALDSGDLGAVALATWAGAEVSRHVEPRLFARLATAANDSLPMTTVTCSWALTAATSAAHLADTSYLAYRCVDRLLAAQGTTGIFPHHVPASGSGRFRAHIGSFADQVYPIQALARFGALTGDQRSLEAAELCARRICDLQGDSGQWWWHYDTRSGEVVEGLPVYSVHQHAMAPMVLFELDEIAGTDHLPNIQAGVDWLYRHPEVMPDLICAEEGVVWRKVARREHAKAVRKISAVTTSVRPGLKAPLLDRMFPPGVIDYECRPYELGWLLYAWLPGHESEEAGRAASE